MTDHPETPDVFRGDTSEVMGAASLVLWTALTRRLVEKGILSADDLQGIIKEAHTEFATEAAGDVKVAEAAMALLARLSMNAI